MGIGTLSQRFCRVCGTQHPGEAGCPGELRTTGAERPGWRIEVETPFGHEAIGVLLAPSHDQWRARIITYPNVLWSAPGGRGTIKFVAGTPEEAESQAISFVEEHVRAKRYLRRDGMALASDKLTTNLRAGAARPLSAAARRKSRCLPVRFGLDRAVSRGMTLNVSSDGMFVHAASPADSGRSLMIHLDLDGYTLPLHGLVMWIRRRSEPERPTGMGVRLSEPPPFYQSFVSTLP